MKKLLIIFTSVTISYTSKSQIVYNVDSKVGGTFTSAIYENDTIISLKNFNFPKEITLQRIDSETIANSPFQSFLNIYYNRSKIDSLDYFFLFNPTTDTFHVDAFGIHAYEFAIDKNGSAKPIEFYYPKGCCFSCFSKMLIQNQILIFKDRNNKTGKFKTSVKLLVNISGKVVKSNTFTKYIDENIFYISQKAVYDGSYEFQNLKHRMYLPNGAKFTFDGMK